MAGDSGVSSRTFHLHLLSPPFRLMNANILWADDEIDLLRPHVMFLEGKGYKVDTVKAR